MTPPASCLHNVETLSAWASSLPLDDALGRIATERPDTRVVELAVGARAVQDPFTVLDSYRSRFAFIAHHTVPLGRGTVLRPDRDDPADLVSALRTAAITTYSAHPLSRRAASSFEELWSWASTLRDQLAAFGCSFALETMYVPRDPAEARASGGYHLDTPAAVEQFLARAEQVGWENPLVLDAAHLHIGHHHGVWPVADIGDLLSAGVAAELHISANDGRRDAHDPLDLRHPVADWVGPHLHRFDVVVDEGRRRTPRGTR